MNNREREIENFRRNFLQKYIDMAKNITNPLPTNVERREIILPAPTEKPVSKSKPKPKQTKKPKTSNTLKLHKKCKKCGEILPITNFRKLNRRNKNGNFYYSYDQYCIKCRREIDREYQAKRRAGLIFLSGAPRPFSLD